MYNYTNSTLIGLEYHKCNEIDVATTDLILLLGKVQDIQSNTYYFDKGAYVGIVGDNIMIY
ncbi:DUF4867 family protein [Clostridium sediminicola]|uniref:DUF4867 family protein n=1 Tax=Clostridium sediminicola TaxID=3114879 RepID=UPI003D172AE6